ncbi:GTP cyclohydrolase II [Pigmentiphaga soli]|uniref:GTP cyclohydrolase II n=1 Tax=Pigmentiphaga soli TaxID=1007095 RepID=A0ABP8H6M5_9BURK
MVTIKNRVVIPLEGAARPPEFITFSGFAEEHIAIVFPALAPDATPLVRVHSECLTGDVFGSQLCDCGPQLHEAIDVFSREGGILLYLRQEGRGIGLYAKLSAYALQKQGLDTFEANRHLNLPEDARSFEPAAQMLKALGITRIRLLTNNPDKTGQLEQYGIEVESTIPTGVYLNPNNRNYLEAKVRVKKHTIPL